MTAIKRPGKSTPNPAKGLPRMTPGAVPGAAPVVADLFTASGRNPFRITGPAAISFSGGRTSGMMLRKVLDAYGGVLPDDVHTVFTNTGAEDDRTLDFVHECEVRWGVRVRWLEFAPTEPNGYREVDYATADRAYGPFNECIRTRSALPNGRMRFCTQDMKLGVLKRFMRAQGYADDEWTNTVGLRADEIHRVMTLRARPETKWDVAAPLLDAGITRPDVMRWWAAQPFDLRTPDFAGNCSACFLKGMGLRYQVERERPGALAWWEAQEAAFGRSFIHSEPRGYAVMRERVRLGIVPGTRVPRVSAPGTCAVSGGGADADDADADGSVTCDCTG